MVVALPMVDPPRPAPLSAKRHSIQLNGPAGLYLRRCAGGRRRLWINPGTRLFPADGGKRLALESLGRDRGHGMIP